MVKVVSEILSIARPFNLKRWDWPMISYKERVESVLTEPVPVPCIVSMIYIRF